MTPELKLEEIQQHIKAAKDSAWVVEDAIIKINNGEEATSELRDLIERNVNHLKTIVANTEIAESGEDISELVHSIAIGEIKLTEDIW